jgi:hypothetical protein
MKMNEEDDEEEDNLLTFASEIPFFNFKQVFLPKSKGRESTITIEALSFECLINSRIASSNNFESGDVNIAITGRDTCLMEEEEEEEEVEEKEEEEEVI